MDLTTLTTALTDAGFEGPDALVGEMQEWGNALRMSDNGPYEVLAVYTRDSTFVQVERTNAPLDLGGFDAQVQYPPVCIIESPKGRVTCNPEDVALVQTLVEEMSE